MPPGRYPFRFDFFHYPPPPPPLPSPDEYLDYFGIPQDSDFRYLTDSDHLFLNPPVRTPPAGWVNFVGLNIGSLFPFVFYQGILIHIVWF